MAPDLLVGEDHRRQEGTVMIWESGRFEPRASQLRDLAAALEVKMDDIELAVPGKGLATQNLAA